MDGYVFKRTIDSKDVIDPRMPAIVISQKLKSDQGVLAAGCIISLSAAALGIPYQKYAALEMAGLRNGTNKVFTYAGAGFDGELAPRSVVITHGDQEVLDDGHGSLYGDGTGTVNYITGVVSVTFDAAPANESEAPELAADSLPIGVLTRAADTSLNDDGKAKNDVGDVLVHGSVTKDLITINGSAASAAEYARLKAVSVFALN